MPKPNIAQGINAMSSFLQGYLTQKEKLEEKQKEQKQVENTVKKLNELEQQGYAFKYTVDPVSGGQRVTAESPEYRKQKAVVKQAEFKQHLQTGVEALRSKRVNPKTNAPYTPWEVYQELATSYPEASVDLKRILLRPQAATVNLNLTDALYGGTSK